MLTYLKCLGLITQRFYRDLTNIKTEVKAMRTREYSVTLLSSMEKKKPSEDFQIMSSQFVGVIYENWEQTAKKR